MPQNIEIAAFTPEEAAYLREYIRLNPVPIEVPPRSSATGTPTRPETIRVPEFLCKAKSPLPAGPLSSPDNRVSVMKGPAHPDGATEIRELVVHWAWVEVPDITIWLGGYNRYGYYYVSPLECPAPS